MLIDDYFGLTNTGNYIYNIGTLTISFITILKSVTDGFLICEMYKKSVRSNSVYVWL